MAKTYEVTKTETEEFVVETEIETVEKTYQKQWLIEEIARLQFILNEFSK